MGTLSDRFSLLDLPSRDPSNFSRCQQPAPSKQAFKEDRPRMYIATHSTLPPPGQVIQTEPQNILLRQFYALGIQRDADPMVVCQTGNAKRAAELSREHVLKRRRGGLVS